jgi:Ca2+-binding EF-hand superfamily protein
MSASAAQDSYAADLNRRKAEEEEKRNLRLKNFRDTDYVRPGIITKNDVQDLKQVFDMIDFDFSGEIDVKELVNAARAMSVKITRDDEQLIQELFNEGGMTGTMTWDSFFECMTKQLTNADMERAPQLFSLMDQDKDGVISLEDMQKSMKMAGSKLKDKQIDDLMNIMNTRKGTKFDTNPKEPYLDMVDFVLALESGIEATSAIQQRAVESQLARQRELLGEADKEQVESGAGARNLSGPGAFAGDELSGMGAMSGVGLSSGARADIMNM